MMSNALVSVVIPTYNNAAFIAQAVRSVLGQSYPHVEIIVIDDGSTDDTGVSLQPFMSRIHYHYQENQGVSAARNAGISLANGRYIAFLDGDDQYLPDKLEKQVALMEAHPEAGCCHSGWIMVSEEDGAMSETAVSPWQDAPQLTLKNWLLWKPVFLGAMLFRREWLILAGGFDPSLPQAEDVDLLLRLAVQGCKTIWYKAATVLYRQHGSSTMRNGRVQAECINRVMANFFARKDLPAEAKNVAMDVRYYTHMWTVWQLMRTGYTDEIVPFLVQSRAFRPQSWRQTLQDWIWQIKLWCDRDNVPVTYTAEFWPFFREALRLSPESWEPIQQALDWWLAVWLPCQQGEHLPDFAAFRHLPQGELIDLAKNGVVYSPLPPDFGTIWRFRRYGRAEGILPAQDDSPLVAIALTVFGQAALMKRPFQALGAFITAILFTRRPRALKAWQTFISNALVYFEEGE